MNCDNLKTVYDIMSNEAIQELKKRYKKLHPVCFIYSLERAQSLTHLADILDTFPGLPAKWDFKSNCWIKG